MVSLASQRHIKARILGNLVGLSAGADHADLSLVEHKILQRGDRIDHLGVRAEVIELRFRQRHHGAGQFADRSVPGRWRFAQRQTELGIKFIGVDGAAGKLMLVRVPATTLQQHPNGPLAQEPHARVHQGEEILGQRPNLLGRGLLEEELELRGALAR